MIEELCWVRLMVLYPELGLVPIAALVRRELRLCAGMQTDSLFAARHWKP